jgi:hypothetical protein
MIDPYMLGNMLLLGLTCMARFAKVEQWFRRRYLDATIRRIFLSPQPCEVAFAEVDEVQEVNNDQDWCTFQKPINVKSNECARPTIDSSIFTILPTGKASR